MPKVPFVHIDEWRVIFTKKKLYSNSEHGDKLDPKEKKCKLFCDSGTFHVFYVNIPCWQSTLSYFLWFFKKKSARFLYKLYIKKVSLDSPV